MEQLLHYVWKHKAFPLSPLQTTSGQPVEVIDPGLPNMHAGPDFFNAKLKIDGTLWVGNVEIHTQASDWLRHGHHRDKTYDNVILHVVGEEDCAACLSNGQPIPQLLLHCPEDILRHYDELRRSEIYPPCYSILGSLPKLTVHSWLSALQVERFEQKSRAIAARLERCNHHWEDVFFITLARNFGFGLNGDAFEAWAGRLPFRAVDKHRDNLFQVEVFFLGQAGLLEDAAAEEEDAYYQQLRKEFLYLQHKFELPAPPDCRPMALPALASGQLPSCAPGPACLFVSQRAIAIFPHHGSGNPGSREGYPRNKDFPLLGRALHFQEDLAPPGEAGRGERPEPDTYQYRHSLSLCLWPAQGGRCPLRACHPLPRSAESGEQPRHPSVEWCRSARLYRCRLASLAATPEGVLRQKRLPALPLRV